ncbi:hypothetical protein B0H14DRAFT_3421951 [Mycena olivaceomarginata]|nr:hypothetical protein B0H14DRAFT_3421951 [Mycena olivaceomarginata]
MSMSTAFQLLENASGLEVFYIEIEGPGVARSSVLVMKSVLTMEIACSDGEHLGQFLKQLEFPCLTSMAFREVVSAWPERECHSFLSRSSCALKTLELIDVRTPQDHIIACLQHKACATLEWLHTNMQPTDALLQHLTYRGHPFPNPKLRTIKLENIRAADGLLSALVESRLFLSTTVTGLPPGVPVPAWLQRVRFTFVEGLAESRYVTHKEDWERLREIKRKALDIDLNVEIFWSDESGTFEVVS